MGDSRVNAGVKVPPELKRALQLQADKEDRTLSKLCELLLSWSLKQLQIAGNSFALQERSIEPSLHEAATEGVGQLFEAQRKAQRNIAADEPPLKKKRAG